MSNSTDYRNDREAGYYAALDAVDAEKAFSEYATQIKRRIEPANREAFMEGWRNCKAWMEEERNVQD